jgi:hypothetical protein
MVVAHLKANLTETPAATKKARNLKLAKEQLYEMKRTIDAKVNLDRLESSSSSSVGLSAKLQPPPVIVATAAPLSSKQLRQPTPVTPNFRLENKPAASASSTGVGQRTTPRKVKKRSGERSLTTGIILDQSDMVFDDTTPNCKFCFAFNSHINHAKKY